MVPTKLFIASSANGVWPSVMPCLNDFLPGLKTKISLKREPCCRKDSIRHVCMQDFSSPSYWNALYSEDSTERSTEWHLEGEDFISYFEGVLGSSDDHKALLNVGCGTSAIWSR